MSGDMRFLTPDRGDNLSARLEEAPWSPWGRALLRFSLIDWLVILYVLIFGLSVAFSSPRHLADRFALVPLLSGLAFLSFACFYKSRLDARGPAQHFYRTAPIAVVALTYFNLRHIIPIVNNSLADARLAALDTQLFGLHGSVWLERWAGLFSVEFFSVWYQSYMFLGGAFLLLEILLDRNHARRAFLGVSMILVLTLGHACYLLVPARGPVYFLQAAYQAPLPGGPIYAHVMSTQADAGPLFDAFPSEHTAIALLLAIFIHLFYPRFRLPAWIWCSLVVASTVFLRFHYVIDVICGILLTVGVVWLTPRLLEAYRRAQELVGNQCAEPW